MIMPLPCVPSVVGHAGVNVFVVVVPASLVGVAL